jgi:hypothetical protein
MFSWRSLAITALLYWVTICFGISMGYHRLHTHRSYRIPLALEFFGWPPIGCTIRNRTSRAIRTLRAMAVGGLTWAGFCGAKPTTTTPR